MTIVGAAPQASIGAASESWQVVARVTSSNSEAGRVVARELSARCLAFYHTQVKTALRMLTNEPIASELCMSRRRRWPPPLYRIDIIQDHQIAQQSHSVEDLFVQLVSNNILSRQSHRALEKCPKP